MEQTTYKIGEVAKLLGIKTHVIRFWESEFSQIRPLRTPKGQRYYTQKHIRTIEKIQYLLHTCGLSIPGAKRELNLVAKPHHGTINSKKPWENHAKPARPQFSFTSNSLSQLDNTQQEPPVTTFGQLFLDASFAPETPTDILIPEQTKHSETPQITQCFHCYSIISECIKEVEALQKLLIQ